MSNESIDVVEEFVRENQRDIISFEDAKNYVKYGVLNRIVGSLNKRILKDH